MDFFFFFLSRRLLSFGFRFIGFLWVLSCLFKETVEFVESNLFWIIPICIKMCHYFSPLWKKKNSLSLKPFLSTFCPNFVFFAAKTVSENCFYFLSPISFPFSLKPTPIRPCSHYRTETALVKITDAVCNGKKHGPRVLLLYSHTLTILLISDTCIFHTFSEFSTTLAGCPITQFISHSTWSKHQVPQGKGSVPQGCTHSRHPSQVAGCHLYFWLPGSKLGFPDPLLGFSHLQKWLTEPREVIVYWFTL